MWWIIVIRVKRVNTFHWFGIRPYDICSRKSNNWTLAILRNRVGWFGSSNWSHQKIPRSFWSTVMNWYKVSNKVVVLIKSLFEPVCWKRHELVFWDCVGWDQTLHLLNLIIIYTSRSSSECSNSHADQDLLWSQKSTCTSSPVRTHLCLFQLSRHEYMYIPE